MKTYSDLTTIDHRLLIQLELKPVGTPEVFVTTPTTHAGGKLFKSVVIETYQDLLIPFEIGVELKNKIYQDNTETAVIIKSLQVDGIDLIPKFDYLARYDNDHANTNPTSYLNYNGKWTLTFDRPFYQWLHQVTNQGWLLS